MIYFRKQFLLLLFNKSAVIPRKTNSILAYMTPVPSVVVF